MRACAGLLVWTVTGLAGVVATGHAATPPARGAHACWIPDVPTQAWCGVLQRPLDPAQPTGPQIDVHWALIPALARLKKPDPVVFLAGGPGQSAVDLAGSARALLVRLGTRRDLLLVDQRGTGRSAPLRCADDEPESAWRPVAQQWDRAQHMGALATCRAALSRLPHGQLQHYTTTVAVGDLLAVLDHLRMSEVNLVGGSYGTRVALEVLRQAPMRVRRAVLDGVAPPDMRLPWAGEADATQALAKLWQACEADSGCRARHSGLAQRWSQGLAALPREVTVSHPLTGTAERVTLTAEVALSLLRSALYAPILSAQLPAAMEAALAGRWSPLLGLASSTQSSLRRPAIASGMHFSVACAEDMGGLASASAASGLRAEPSAHPADGATAHQPVALEWGLVRLYSEVCRAWPQAPLAPGFETMPAARAPVWLLSGGLDPVTPPRHAEHVQARLGRQAVHTVVPHAGHGVMGLACMREAVARFIDAGDAAHAQRLAQDERCGANLPRPPVWAPPGETGRAGVSR